jgi:hypothetical protein
MQILNNNTGIKQLRIRDVYPGSDFFHPGSRIRTVSIPDPGSASNNLGILYILTQKNGFYAVEKLSGLFIPDPGVKKAPDPGSGSATLEYKSIRNRNLSGWSSSSGMERQDELKSGSSSSPPNMFTLLPLLS